MVDYDENGYEHLFHNTMIKPYTTPNLQIKDLLNTTESEEVDSDPSVYYTQTVNNANEIWFKELRQKKYDGIKAKGGFLPFNFAELPWSPNIIGKRFILGNKNPGTQSELLKARWMLLGHTDAHRHEIANNSPMLKSLTLRITASLAVPFFSLVLELHDVEQAYM